MTKTEGAEKQHIKKETDITVNVMKKLGCSSVFTMGPTEYIQQADNNTY